MCVTEDYDGALGVFTEMAYLAQESGGKSLTGDRLKWVSWKCPIKNETYTHAKGFKISFAKVTTNVTDKAE